MRRLIIAMVLTCGMAQGQEEVNVNPSENLWVVKGFNSEKVGGAINAYFQYTLNANIRGYLMVMRDREDESLWRPTLKYDYVQGFSPGGGNYALGLTNAFEVGPIFSYGGWFNSVNVGAAYTWVQSFGINETYTGGGFYCQANSLLFYPGNKRFGSVVSNVWYHAAVTHDAQSNTVCYFNGQPANSFVVGNSPNRVFRMLAGSGDKCSEIFLIIGKTLSAKEVADKYNSSFMRYK